MSESKAALSAFREEVAAWMAENVPADPGFLLPLTFLEVRTEQQLDFLVSASRAASGTSVAEVPRWACTTSQPDPRMADTSLGIAVGSRSLRTPMNVGASPAACSSGRLAVFSTV